MDTVSGAYTRYMDRREKLLDAIRAHDRRIERFFLFDRCIEGLKILSCVMTLCGIAVYDNTIAISGAFGMIGMGVVSFVAGIKRAVDGESERKKQTEQHLQILDEAWRQWTMPRHNGFSQESKQTDV